MSAFMDTAEAVIDEVPAAPATPRLVFDSSAPVEAFQAPVPQKTVEPIKDNVPAVIDNPVQTRYSDNQAFEEASDEGMGKMVDNGVDASEDFDSMSVEELRRRQEEIDRKIRAKQEAEKKAIIEQIVEVVKTYKIPVDELNEALGGVKIKRKGAKALPKYRDPATGVTWTGRGKEPLWIKGKDREPFLIK